MRQPTDRTKILGLVFVAAALFNPGDVYAICQDGNEECIVHPSEQLTVKDGTTGDFLVVKTDRFVGEGNRRMRVGLAFPANAKEANVSACLIGYSAPRRTSWGKPLEHEMVDVLALNRTTTTPPATAA